MFGDEHIVEFLLDLGADASKKDGEGRTAAEFAHAHGHDTLADIMEHLRWSAALAKEAEWKEDEVQELQTAYSNTGEERL